MQVPGFDKVRVGGESDGAYVMLDDFQGVRHALSLGISTNVDWDIGVAERGLLVHQFDHTVEGPPLAHPNFRFHKRMIRGRTHDDHGARFDDGSITVGEILTDIGVVEEASAILKMDIECFEFPVLRHIATPDLLRFRQIVVEFHAFNYMGHDDLFMRAFHAIARLTRFFDMIHIHANNTSDCNAWDIDGFVVADVFEVTMVNRRYYKTEPSRETYPTSLDRPNDPNRVDWELGRFNH